MAGIPTFTNEELKKALIKTGGKPVKAAEMLGVEYFTVWTRIRNNPELLEVQKSARAKKFNEYTDILDLVAKTGYIQRSVIDENGKVTAKVELVPVDERTRIDTVNRLATMYKADEGIADEVNVNINGKGSINVAKWLELNNEGKDAEGAGEETE